MIPRTVKNLPTDYQEALFLRVTTLKNMILMNIAAVLLLVVNGAVFIGGLLAYHSPNIGAPFVISAFPQQMPQLLGVGIVLLILPFHEWVHGLAIRYWGHQPRYGIKPLKGVLYATADGALFWRNQYIVVALAPLVVISALLISFSLFLPAELGFWLMIAATVNATGAVGDLWMTWVAQRFEPDALISDEEDGMRVYTPKH